MDFEDLVRRIRQTSAPPGVATKIVAVDGHGGAGKTTLAARLANALGCEVIQTDDFASWDNPVDWWPRLLEEALEPLAKGEPARFRCTNWEGGPERERVVEAADCVVLEGVTASREAFRLFLAFSIWVDAPREVRLARGLSRDGEESRAQWEEWMAAEDEYVARERPRERADAVVSGTEPW